MNTPLFFKNNYIISGIIALVCAAVVFFGIHSYVQWKGNYYFGRVIATSSESITLLGKERHKYIVDIDSTTVIKKGLKVHNTEVGVGDRVIVVGKVDPDAHIDASLIRILGHE